MSIQGIFIATEGSAPMQSLEEAILIEGCGIEGDRYCSSTGTYSCLRGSSLRKGEKEAGRQITLISADSVNSTLREQGMTCPDIGNLRRNVVLQGISGEELLRSIGHVIRLGDNCQVVAHRNCVPCMYNERKNNIPGLMEAIFDVAGVSCEVLVGGQIQTGNTVKVLWDEKREIDGGLQSSGFFVRPKERTAAMVKEGIAGKREAKEALMKTDPEGVERLERSYNSVGIKFWPADKE
ncbi:unnamed protein product [Cylindrotheca closterium]|uniref:MOSC domain-containing protein n=1 Tax=Cylindrotheca closterium TaxID=2856 RepID=A0AAD2CGG3_9STRA|nr:unnamed protein product [Cylindrotheca closterium]